MPRCFFACTLFALLISASAIAQKCTEQLIKEKDGNMPTPAESKAPDVFFFSPMIDKPIVGSQEWKSVSEKDKSIAKNVKDEYSKVDRVVVTPSGDMAYSYGISHSTFDDETGKHQDFTAAFLDVWRVVDGSCKLAARMVEPEGGKR